MFRPIITVEQLSTIYSKTGPNKGLFDSSLIVHCGGTGWYQTGFLCVFKIIFKYRICCVGIGSFELGLCPPAKSYLIVERKIKNYKKGTMPNDICMRNMVP